MTRALLNTASPAACLKVGSWISAERLSWYGSCSAGVVLVGPGHRQLQRAAGVEAGRARVGDGRRPPRRTAASKTADHSRWRKANWLMECRYSQAGYAALSRQRRLRGLS